MRFGTGGTIGEFYKRTTPLEREGWYSHFRAFPPGDFYVQNILARLCALIATALSGETVSPAEYAPWINWKMDLAGAEAAQERTELAGLAALMEQRADG